jgi:hypothetical protein
VKVPHAAAESVIVQRAVIEAAATAASEETAAEAAALAPAAIAADRTAWAAAISAAIAPQADSAAATAVSAAARAVREAAQALAVHAVAAASVEAVRRVAAEAVLVVVVLAAEAAEDRVAEAVAAGEDAVRQEDITMKNRIILNIIIGCSLFTIGVSAQVRKFDSKAFATPDEAATAIITAASTYDEAALKEILGPNSFDIVHTGEPAADKQTAMDFAAMGNAAKKISYDPRNKMRATLLVGDDSWPFPVPLVKQGKNWYFDTKAGRQEILYRRIGNNELTAIQIMRGYVEAQQEYSLTKHDGALVNQYAQRLISTLGKHDGLAWQNPDGTWDGVIGDNVAKELEKSYAYSDKPQPFHGYYFKILKGQGPAAPLGKMDFILHDEKNGDAMIGGFALLAVPSFYQLTGVKSFMVSHDGVVYEKDLGPDSIAIGKAMEEYNPDNTWRVVKD